ncbi:hypothetical protein A9Q81_27980 [Gammaproteobacteria bacterium 42_54_T18]|nr:hypothetical protein A9Q81_27980 [Gammaproteobacteria bacterium 42_54_T18]
MNTAQAINILNDTPQLVILTPPLQGRKVPLEDLDGSQHFQFDHTDKLRYLAPLLPAQQQDMAFTFSDEHWMISSTSKHLRVNNEPVYTAILEDRDVIQYGKLRCRFHSTPHQANLHIVAPTKRKRAVAISAAATIGIIAAATSFIVLT